MTDAAAAFYDVPSFDGRVFSFGDWRRFIRIIGGNVVMGLGAVAAVGLLVATVTFAAAWIVNNALAARPHIHAMGPGALALVDPTLAGAAAVSFEDKWARATASMQASAVPLLPPHPLEIGDNVPVPPPSPLEAPLSQA